MALMVERHIAGLRVGRLFGDLLAGQPYGDRMAERPIGRLHRLMGIVLAIPSLGLLSLVRRSGQPWLLPTIRRHRTTIRRRISLI
jgi:hypothetical protein